MNDVLQRGEEGEFVQEQKPADILEIMEPLEPAMTSEIAEELGWPRRTAYEVLNGLADDGKNRKKKPLVYCRKARRMSP
ncbi:helix-turn-helix domain-containing protein [Haladaptatus sp. DFWS20]|uniref:helix-turn-helix domain-containing protein n=1 Tax=Haladaptatus sp. DFWS20 TaxID=3403467 RepID=UPI003EB8C35E